jgi:O-acetyl-ADP-ribose deacetylase
MLAKDQIDIILGDIALIKVDAVVNAANNSLLGGGGVDGAIHRAAGPQLLEECKKLRGCPTGEAKITKGYNLPADRIIHTVGPIWEGGNHGEDQLLAQCYRNCLHLAKEYKLRTIAFPSISTGAYGFPTDRASNIALTEIKLFLEKNALPEKVIIVCFDRFTRQCYLKAL